MATFNAKLRKKLREKYSEVQHLVKVSTDGDAVTKPTHFGSSLKITKTTRAYKPQTKKVYWYSKVLIYVKKLKSKIL